MYTVCSRRSDRYALLVTNPAVIQLSESEYRRVWDRFYTRFDFRPSTKPAKWPGSKQPDASVTWSLASLDDDPNPHLRA
ncbi:DUF2716 domain-containing protein [Streptomyces sp. NPDC047841]|uniref:DUF2716 domain-containing protein n=1 Tax=Streptomyces sp. NPDC047841 TaxID=3154708 RepID=UPI0034543166